MHIYIVAMVLLLLNVSFIKANTDSIKVYYPGEVVITADFNIKTISPTQRTTSLLKLSNRDILSSADALTAIGIGSVLKNSRNESVFNMRGFGHKQIAIFFDGVPISSPSDAYADLDIIPSNILSKVSFTKTSAVNAYGSNTMGGAVNLISDEYSETINIAGKAIYGTSKAIDAKVGGRISNFSYLISGEYLSADNIKTPIFDNDFLSSELYSRNNSEFQKKSAYAKVSLNYSAHSFITLSALHSEGKRNVPINIHSQRKRYWRFTDLENDIYSLIFLHSFSQNITIRANAYYSGIFNKLSAFDDSTYSTQTMRSSFNSVFDDYSTGANINSAIKILDNLSGNISISYKYDKHSSKPGVNQDFQNFAAEIFTYGADFSYSFDKFSSFFSIGQDLIIPKYADGNELRARENAINIAIGSEFEIDNLGNVFVSISRKTRFPTLKELYSEFLGRNEANPNLKPEVAFNGELGIRTSKLFGIDAVFTVFASRLSDLMQWTPVENDLRMLQNIGKVLFSGVELELNKKFDLITINLDYKYLYALNIESETEKFEERPGHIFRLFASSEIFKNTKLSLETSYISNRYSASFDTQELMPLDHYFIVNARFSKKFFDSFTVFLRANNILNSYYETVYGFPAEGRNFALGISFNY